MKGKARVVRFKGQGKGGALPIRRTFVCCHLRVAVMSGKKYCCDCGEEVLGWGGK